MISFDLNKGMVVWLASSVAGLATLLSICLHWANLNLAQRLKNLQQMRDGNQDVNSTAVEALEHNYTNAQATIRNLRQEVQELNAAHETAVKELANKTQEVDVLEGLPSQRNDTYQQFVKLQEREKDLFVFLQTHFPAELEMAQVENRSLIACSQAIMLKGKRDQ